MTTARTKIYVQSGVGDLVGAAPDCVLTLCSVQMYCLLVDLCAWIGHWRLCFSFGAIVAYVWSRSCLHWVQWCSLPFAKFFICPPVRFPPCVALDGIQTVNSCAVWYLCISWYVYSTWACMAVVVVTFSDVSFCFAWLKQRQVQVAEYNSGSSVKSSSLWLCECVIT